MAHLATAVNYAFGRTFRKLRGRRSAESVLAVIDMH